MSLGLAIGAITFTGSIIAFSKLQGIMKGAPINFPMQHQLNLGLGVLLVVLIVIFVITQAQAVFLAHCLPRLRHGLPDHHPDWRCRHAGGDLDAQ